MSDNNTFWKYSGCEFIGWIKASEEDPAHAFAIVEDGRMYYYVFWVCGTTQNIMEEITICFITDATDFNNQHVAGLKHFRKACLNRAELTVTHEFEDLSNHLDKTFFKYDLCGEIIVNLQHLDKTAIIANTHSIHFKPEYLGKRLVHYYFDYLIHLREAIRISINNLSITDRDVTVK